MKTALNPAHDHAKNCPFCGSDGEWLRYKARPGSTFDGIGVFDADYPNVECLMCYFCGAAGPKSDHANSAVTKWNRRTR